MTQHRREEVYSVENTRLSNLELSLKQPNAASIKLLGQWAFAIAHIVVSVNVDKMTCDK
jgi:hypothetical protein